ncbi:hypothetical protein KUF73_24130 [Pseudomonas sp. PD9R]|nr:hypothetical protein [Pseudomonas sp. PD9R]
MGGCSTVPTESFTFQADMPENFEIDGTAHYVAVPGQTCNFSSDKQRKDAERLFLRTPQPKAAHRVEFTVPLTAKAHGCSMILRSLGLGFEGQWGRRDQDKGMQYGGISILDEPSENAGSFPASGALVFQGQCQWFFRTSGPYRYIKKIPQCRALDVDGNVKKRLIGGAVQREQLAGKTVKLILTMANEEEPYYGRTWIKTPAGWKPCIETKEAFWCRNPPEFTNFKTRDGRVCTVYPNCTE